MSKWNECFDTSAEMICGVLAHRIEHQDEIYGSSAYIGPGIFLSANHLADSWYQEAEHQDRFYRAEQIADNSTAKFELDILHVMKDDRVAVWAMNKLRIVRKTDMIMLIDLGNNNSNVQLVADIDEKFLLIVHPPYENEKVTMIGYPKAQKISLPSNKAAFGLQIEANEGVVNEFMKDGNGTIKTPLVQVEGQIKGGMSGGPALNAKGEMFGINSMGLPAYSPNDTDTGYITLLWHAFTIEFDTPQFGATNLYHLAKEGFISVKGLEHFDVKDGAVVGWNRFAENCVDCQEVIQNNSLVITY